jgi:hypothetical protein
MPETIGIEENELHRRNLENKADEQNQHVKKHLSLRSQP